MRTLPGRFPRGSTDARADAGRPGATARIRRATVADAPRLAFIRTASWRDAYSEIIGHHALERTARHDADRMRRAVGQQHGGQAVWLVEDDHGTAFGYTWSGPQTDRTVVADGRAFLGEVYELYLHPQWQGLGAGSELLVHTIWALVGAGLNPPMLWVLGENTARHFYEGTGGVAFATRRIEVGRVGGVGGRAMTKIGYGWHEQLPLPR